MGVSDGAEPADGPRRGPRAGPVRSTAPLAVANYTYDTLPPAARAAVPTDTQLANAADVALNQLTANPDTVAGPGPGDQPDAAAQPDRKRRPYKSP